MSEIDHGDHTHPGMDTEELSYHARRVRAMETLLAEKGVLTIEEVQRNVDNVESRSPPTAPACGPRLGQPGLQSQAAGRPRGGAGRDGLRAARPDAPSSAWWRTPPTCITWWSAPSASCYPRALLGRPPRLVQELRLPLAGRR